MQALTDLANKLDRETMLKVGIVGKTAGFNSCQSFCLDKPESSSSHELVLIETRFIFLFLFIPVIFAVCRFP